MSSSPILVLVIRVRVSYHIPKMIPTTPYRKCKEAASSLKNLPAQTVGKRNTGISGITYRQISHPLININAKCQPENNSLWDVEFVHRTFFGAGVLQRQNNNFLLLLLFARATAASVRGGGGAVLNELSGATTFGYTIPYTIQRNAGLVWQARKPM